MKASIKLIEAGKYTSGYDDNLDFFAIKIDPKLTVYELRNRVIKRLLELNYSPQESANVFNNWACIDSNAPDSVLTDAIGVSMDANYFYHFMIL